MAYGVGASGFVGIAVETVSNTYVAPAVYLPLLSESLQFDQMQIERRPLRGIADMSGMLPGDSSVKGSIKCEITPDSLAYLLRSARVTIVKSGAGPYTYTCTPNANAVPAQTMSVTVVRNGLAFGYVGCLVSSQKYSIDGGILVGEFDIVGTNEAAQSLPTPTYALLNPPSTGLFALKFATVASTEADTFEFTIDDKAEPQFRLQGGSARGAVFVKYGERTVELGINRDFQNRTDYDAFKAMTAQAVDLDMVVTAASNEVHFNIPAAIKSTYEIQGLAGQADLIRANITYQGVYDTVTSKSYQIVLNSAVSVTIP